MKKCTTSAEYAPRKLGKGSTLQLRNVKLRTYRRTHEAIGFSA